MALHMWWFCAGWIVCDNYNQATHTTRNWYWNL